MSKTTNRIYQVGDYWLAKRPGREAWHRCFFDPEKRQTRYVSLKTEDLGTAKQELDQWFAANLSKQFNIGSPTLFPVLRSYFEEHACKLSSAERIKIGIRYWEEYFGDIEISELREMRRQIAFQQWLRDKGQVDNMINQTLAVGKAAINRAHRMSMLQDVQVIHLLKTQASPPKGRPLDVSEIARLIDATDSEHLIDFIIWGLATAARPDALRDLTWEQIDWENALINLNPEGRTQTTKRRPVVKLPPILAEFYGEAHFSGAKGPVVTFDGKPVKSVRTAWRKARDKAGLDKHVQPYSLRHTVARWLRKDGVPVWEVAAQLGHSTARHEMTERYAAFSPDYLEKSATSLDRLLNELRDTCVTLSKSRFAVKVPKSPSTKEKEWWSIQGLNL